MHFQAKQPLVRVFIGISIALLILLSGCENPFTVGFGDDVDIDRPDGDITGLDPGQYLSGNVSVTGDYSDDSSSIPTVQISIDDGASYRSAIVNADGWTYNLDTTALPDGELELVVLITDASGKQTEKRQLYYVDNTRPLVLVRNPQGYATTSYNGNVTVRGEAADLFAIDEVRVQIQDDSGNGLTGFELADGTNSWVYEFDSRVYADPAGNLRLAVQATDRAGNTSTTLLHYDDVLRENSNVAISVEDLLRIRSGQVVAGAVISQDDVTNTATDTPAGVVMGFVPVAIDNDLDKPTVTIVSPTNGQSVGGSVLVTGTAFDDDALDFVEMRIDLNGDGDFDDAFDLNTNGDTLDEFEDEDVWVTLAGTVVWARELNGDGELYQVEPGHNGQITIQVRAVDDASAKFGDPAVTGNTSEIAINLDDSLPRVEGLLIEGEPYTGGISVRGTDVTISTRDTQTTPGIFDGGVRDDTQIDLVRISYDGGVSYADIFRRENGFNDGSVIETGPNDLRFEKSIDTTSAPVINAIVGAPGEDDNGILYMRLLVFDNNDPVPYQTFTFITLNVDNRYPTGTSLPVTVEPLEIEGTAALVQGEAEDSGVVGGIDQVHVYFVRGGQVYDLSATNSTVPVVSADFYDGDLDDAVKSFPYTPPNGSSATPPLYPPPYYHIAIDNTLEFGNDLSGTGDGDSFNERLTLSGGTYSWSADFDSTRIPDGEIELHYVVFDDAGNGTHYQRDAFIKNNRPVINDLTVGTNLDFSLAVEADERFVYDEMDADFGTRSLLYVQIDANDTGGSDGGGIDTADYQVFRDNPDPTPDLALTAATGDFESGGTIDISGWTGDEDSVVNLYVQVTDSDGIVATKPFSITVDNQDSDAPSVTLNPFDQTSVVDGHVESAAEARDFAGYDGTSVADTTADVSGTVTISGTATDSQRIQQIYLRIQAYNPPMTPNGGYDADGAGGLFAPGGEYLLASWDASDGRLEYNTDLGFAANTPSHRP